MSANDETPADDASAEGQEPEREAWDEDRAKAKIQKANAEAASLRKRLRDLEPLARKAQEQDEASKTEQERLTERLTAAESRAADAEARYLRMEVAAEKGLSAKQARRLVGTSREELEADAEELLQDFGDRKPPSRRPTEQLRGGSDPDEEPEETDPRKLAAAHPRI